MPRGDRTGPNGNGPMTGRQMGNCTGTDQNYGRGNGGGFARGGGRNGRRVLGRGNGAGFGFRNGYNDFVPNVSDKTLLENDIKILQDQLKSLEKQLTEAKKED
ncbi:MAG: DUF5320 domain-containing protein [Candidatus Delongbacteria bacterium]|nr:DUF5320 domain-containing protein [Candidatus Delongbacteria bacterium]